MPTRTVLQNHTAIPYRLLPLALLALAVPAGAGAQSPHVDDPAADPGSLYAELARMDSIFFDALFANCDAPAANALLTRDVEFYDDRTGLTSGDEVREGFERLVGNCPADNGVRRVLLPNTVEVYPIHGVGALQTGIHHFVERGASNSTIARFYVVWVNDNGGWKMSRIMSVDHKIVDAARAADLRRHPSH